MAKKEAAAAPEQGEAAPKGNKKKLMLIIGGAVGVLVIGIVVAVLLLGGKDEEEAEEEAEVHASPALYVALGEKFVVTLPAAGQGKPHYLQVAISAMTRDKAVIEELEFNAPLLRDRLNSLLSKQDFERLRSEEGKVALRGEVLGTVQGIVDSQIAAGAKKEGGDEDEEEEEEEKPKKKKKGAEAVEEKPPGVEQIFFTEFVLQ